MNSIKQILFFDKKFSVVWLLVRVYLGWEWLVAGYEKFINPAWIGQNSGAAVTGFVKGALLKTAGAHPDVSGWYAGFLGSFVLPYAKYWSVAVTFGELLVGIGLILGALTTIAAFFGFFMNLNYLLAGTVSTNPQMLILALLLILAHRTSGIIGLDHYFHNIKSWAMFRKSSQRK